MDQRRERPLARSAVLAIVIGGHVLLVLLLIGSKPERRSDKQAPEFRSVLVLLNLEKPKTIDTPPPAEDEPRTPATPNGRNRLRSAARSAEPVSESPALADAPGAASGPADEAAPAIDWNREMSRTAQDLAPGLLKKQQRECEEAKKLGKYPPGCRKPDSAYNKEWEPELPRAGFHGILPYVRIGRGCVVGLGFFGCTLDPPPPDGTLFEHMRDPERPRGSVPDDADESGLGMATLPRAQAFKDAE